MRREATMDKLFKQSASMMVILLMSILTFSAKNVNAQLVTNGSFEDSDTGQVSGTDVKGWVIEVAQSVNPTPMIEIVGDTVQRGNRALKVTVNAIGSNAWDI